MRKVGFILAPAALAVCAVLPVAAQRAAMTAADYARAENFMNYNVTPLVYRSGVRGNWLADDRVWYRVTTESGSVATLVDPATEDVHAGRFGRFNHSMRVAAHRFQFVFGNNHRPAGERDEVFRHETPFSEDRTRGPCD